MLWEEMEKYTKLTGEDATHVPIMKIGAYLDGYEKGTEVLAKIKTEIEQTEINGHIRDVECFRAGINVALNIINKYKDETESESKE